MSKKTVYIDGQEGTTGLKIQSRLAGRQDIELIRIDEARRKDTAERKKLMNQADLVFLCLPDKAAAEAAGLVENPGTKIIDASTAHRTNPAWAYGFPELSPAHREAVGSAMRIANPGCHATGFLSIVYPLVKAGVLPADYPLVCHSVTGYSGGGKSMIALYEQEAPPAEYDSPRQYGLNLKHKHLPEMQAVAGLTHPPIFNPIVADFYAGMAVSVGLHVRLLDKKMGPEEIRALLAGHYAGEPQISVQGPEAAADGFLAANTLAGADRLELIVCGSEEQVNIVARFDNLGKGASGAAVQNMNIALGLPETAGLL